MRAIRFVVVALAGCGRIGFGGVGAGGDGGGGDEVYVFSRTLGDNEIAALATLP